MKPLEDWGAFGGVKPLENERKFMMRSVINSIELPKVKKTLFLFQKSFYVSMSKVQTRDADLPQEETFFY